MYVEVAPQHKQPIPNLVGGGQQKEMVVSALSCLTATKSEFAVEPSLLRVAEKALKRKTADQNIIYVFELRYTENPLNAKLERKKCLELQFEANLVSRVKGGGGEENTIL